MRSLLAQGKGLAESRWTTHEMALVDGGIDRRVNEIRHIVPGMDGEIKSTYREGTIVLWMG
jgi:hypothetical protein